MVVVEIPPDEVLVQQTLEQDAQGTSTPRSRTAFEMLYERHKNPIFTYFTLHGITQHQTAEDLTQETFMNAWRGLPGKSPEAPFRRWLFTIAIHERDSYFRSLRSKKRAALLFSLEGMTEKNPGALPPSTAPAIDEYLIQQEQIVAILAGLPLRERQCLILIDRYGFSVAEVASMLKIKENSVTGAHSRARQHFRERYQSLNQPLP